MFVVCIQKAALFFLFSQNCTAAVCPFFPTLVLLRLSDKRKRKRTAGAERLLVLDEPRCRSMDGPAIKTNNWAFLFCSFRQMDESNTERWNLATFSHGQQKSVLVVYSF